MIVPNNRLFNCSFLYCSTSSFNEDFFAFMDSRIMNDNADASIADYFDTLRASGLYMHMAIPSIVQHIGVQSTFKV